MNPAEALSFLLLGLALLLVIAAAWVIFRKRKKWAVVVTCLLVIGYAGYYAYFPTMQMKIHAAKYEQVREYLEGKYPDRQFEVEPEQYEGYYVGIFDVNDKETPDFGVTLSVKRNGGVYQVGSWDAGGFSTQKNLWKTLQYGYHSDYTLDSEILEIIKKDEWIDGELTVFALMINGKPAIAIFKYSAGGYNRLALEESVAGSLVTAEADDRVFIFIDEAYKENAAEVELHNGDMLSVNAAVHKGTLLVVE